MTPANIAGMAYLAGMKAFAITDHNSALNLPAAKAAADKLGLALLPGMEVTTREETHCLVYFESVENALAFGEVLYESLGASMNLPRLFGNQYVADENDTIVKVIPKLLIQASSFSIDKLSSAAHEYGGLLVPAHINRGSNGMLSSLGMVPQSPRFTALEVSRGLPCPDTDSFGYRRIHSSDAHRLEQIIEPAFHIDLPGDEVSARAIYCSMAGWLRMNNEK
jgi:hypothetical protein